MRTIRTQRLRLVPVTPGNAALLWTILQEPDLRDYQDLPTIDRVEFLRTVAARPTRFEPGAVGRFEWLVHLGDRPMPIGWVSLRVSERSRSAGEVGYSIVRAYRGRGVATESVAALLEEGFLGANLHRIRAYCLPENLSSRAVLRRNGFDDEGTLPHGATVQGQPVDVVTYALERERWFARATPNRSAKQS